MAIGRVQSDRFPYLPVQVVSNLTVQLEALIDTGFDGDIAIPIRLLGGEAPDVYQRWSLADNTVVEAPVYRGTVRVGGFPSLPIRVVALGEEVILGRHILERYRVILDHGQRVIVEP